jgi:hypothetical protein
LIPILRINPNPPKENYYPNKVSKLEPLLDYGLIECNKKEIKIMTLSVIPYANGLIKNQEKVTK